MTPLFGVIGSLVSNGLGIFGDWIRSKRELKKARAEAAIKLTQAKVNHAIRYSERAQDANIDWDKIMAEASKTSWKDEWFTILLSIPAIMAFIPGLAPYVGEGFDELRKAPEWYLAAFGLAVAASFGYRKFVDYMKRKKE